MKINGFCVSLYFIALSISPTPTGITQNIVKVPEFFVKVKEPTKSRLAIAKGKDEYSIDFSKVYNWVSDGRIGRKIAPK